MNRDTVVKAMLLVRATRRALEKGIKHYSKDGEFLGTQEEILAALKKDGGVIVKIPDTEKKLVDTLFEKGCPYYGAVKEGKPN